MDNESNRLMLRKIPLFDLLKILEHLYDSGADFVDIVGISLGDKEQDEIMVAVKDEYMNARDTITGSLEEEDDDEEEEEEPDMTGSAKIISEEIIEQTGNFTQQDINDLLNGY